MTEDMAAATGAKMPLTFGGKTYLATPVKASMWGRIHNHLIARRLSVLEQTARTIAEFPKELQAEALKAAMAQAAAPHVVSKETLQGFMESYEGVTTLLWLMLQPDAPELNEVGKVQALVADVPLQVLSKMVSVASGLDAAKNSLGPTANPPAP